MEDLQVYCASMASQLKEWDAKLDALAVKARLATPNVAVELSDEINFLRTKKQAINEKLGDLQTAPPDTCVLIQSDMNDAMRDLESSFQSVAARLT